MVVKSLDEIAFAGAWPGRIRLLQPKNVVELGTGQGYSGLQIMTALPPDAIFTTINYADGHIFGKLLDQWRHDKRLHCIAADATKFETTGMVLDGVDLLFIDTTHEAWHASIELQVWQSKLKDGAIVVVDDLDQCDMVLFWNSLPYEKLLCGNQGVFRYDISQRYNKSFPRLVNTSYKPEWVDRSDSL